MTISAAIPTSSQVAHATNSGEPIISAQPRHPVSQAIAKLARSIAATGADGSGAGAVAAKTARPPLPSDPSCVGTVDKP